ncbi:hypothetical protein M758_4G062900 [Ceratodon purpureus]|uniref:Transmembrane protein n=1 Tax=Ceratodon purpureus TaxID=3225 RepID=A0A8T0I6C0_CERPU|nr:hypothetical protein KC19_4G065300 [Ceratodon purpureus]KAG0618422.1 hypothetical protein M758_4G062900 [Ceratodon purpureus]
MEWQKWHFLETRSRIKSIDLNCKWLVMIDDLYVLSVKFSRTVEASIVCVLVILTSASILTPVFGLCVNGLGFSRFQGFLFAQGFFENSVIQSGFSHTRCTNFLSRVFFVLFMRVYMLRGMLC